MTDYRRKKKSGKQYAGGRIANYRKRPYTARLGTFGGGGSYVGPRNYYRHHDFKYEKETDAKPPKVETHYTIERPIESYRLPAYRPELDQTAVENIVGQAVEKYRRKDLEHEKLEAQHNESESSISLQENNVESKPSDQGLTARDVPFEANLDVSAQPESVSEVRQEAEMALDRSPEPYESSELPIADLELLLIELDANPLETQPEKIVEAEEGVEQ